MESIDYTVIGGNGFIGSHIVKDLRTRGFKVWVPERGTAGVFNKQLGVVIYAAGFGDCNHDPYKVFESNLGYLVNVVKDSSFKKLIYLSSTRVYMNQNSSLESSNLKVIASDSRALFNLTKLTAENLVLSLTKQSIIIRPSNVYGLALNSPLFLPSIVRDAIQKKEVNMYVRRDYAKDYVSVLDLASAIYDLSQKNDLHHRIFNVASGRNVTAEQIANVLKDKTDCKIIWQGVDSVETFPETDIRNVTTEIKYFPKDVLEDLSEMIDSFKTQLGY